MSKIEKCEANNFKYKEPGRHTSVYLFIPFWLFHVTVQKPSTFYHCTGDAFPASMYPCAKWGCAKSTPWLEQRHRDSISQGKISVRVSLFILINRVEVSETKLHLFSSIGIIIIKKTKPGIVYFAEQVCLRRMIVTGALVDTLRITFEISSLRYRA